MTQNSPCPWSIPERHVGAGQEVSLSSSFLQTPQDPTCLLCSGASLTRALHPRKGTQPTLE
jgi:hypothetical protein